jgi:ribonuclease HIII
MDPFVIKVPVDQLDELRVALLDDDHTHPVRTTSQYEAFRFHFAGGTIIGYTSGKVVANSPETVGILTRAAQSLEQSVDTTLTLGSDEAGKGEWLGPLTVAAVCLSEEQAAYLRSVGVMDSKELSPRMVGELAYEIEENSLAIAKVLISPVTFEERLSELHDEGKNLNDLLAWGHAKVIKEVHDQLHTIEDLRIVVDEFAAEKTEERIERLIDLDSIELVQMHRAESVTAVAAASIMARDLRDDWIDKKSGELGYELVGMTIEEALGRKEIEEFAKISYLRK